VSSVIGVDLGGTKIAAAALTDSDLSESTLQPTQLSSQDALIDQVSLVGAPKGGRVAIAGPSFQYFASPEFHGTDSFTLQVTGSKVRVTGTSLIQVDVTVP